MNIVLDEFKETIAANRKTLAANRKAIAANRSTIAAMKKENTAFVNALAEQAKIIAEYQQRYGVLTGLN